MTPSPGAIGFLAALPLFVFQYAKLYRGSSPTAVIDNGDALPKEH